MGLLSGFKQMFNVSKWVGIKQIKAQTNNIKEMTGKLITPTKKNEREETFEQAIHRLKLTESDIETRYHIFRRLIKIYAFLALLISLYIVYLLFKKAWFPSLGCLGILLFIFGQMFYYHFWIYQIQEKRLGCTFREWFNYLVVGNK